MSIRSVKTQSSRKNTSSEEEIQEIRQLLEETEKVTLNNRFIEIIIPYVIPASEFFSTKLKNLNIYVEIMEFMDSLKGKDYNSNLEDLVNNMNRFFNKLHGGKKYATIKKRFLNKSIKKYKGGIPIHYFFFLLIAGINLLTITAHDKAKVADAAAKDALKMTETPRVNINNPGLFDNVLRMDNLVSPAIASVFSDADPLEALIVSNMLTNFGNHLDVVFKSRELRGKISGVNQPLTKFQAWWIGCDKDVLNQPHPWCDPPRIGDDFDIYGHKIDVEHTYGWKKEDGFLFGTAEKWRPVETKWYFVSHKTGNRVYIDEDTYRRLKGLRPRKK